MASIVDVLDQRTVDRSIVPPLLIDHDEETVLAGLPLFSRARSVAARLGGVTLIIPCCNEQDGIVPTMRRIHETLHRIGRPFEVIVVNDGSTDDTRAKLRMCEARGMRVLHNEQNRGYGYSIKRAIHEAQFEIIGICDADGTYPIEKIDDLLRRLDGADMVVGARVTKNAHIPLERRPAKWFLRKLASYLAEVEIPDLNSGLRVMKRSVVRKFLRLLPDGFSFTTTITLAMLTHGYEVRYMPIDYAKRVGRSSIRPVRDTLTFFSLVLRTILYFRPLKIFAPLSALLFVFAVSIALISKIAFGQVADVTCVTLAAGAIQVLAIGLLADLIDKRSPSFT